MHPVTNMCLYGVNSNVKGDETLNIIQLTIKIVTITVLKATSDQKNDNHTHMHTHTYKHTHTLYIYIYTYNIYQVGGSELQPRKVELMSVHSKRHGYREFLQITTKPVITPTKISLTTLIFLS